VTCTLKIDNVMVRTQLDHMTSSVFKYKYHKYLYIIHTKYNSSLEIKTQ